MKGPSRPTPARRIRMVALLTGLVAVGLPMIPGRAANKTSAPGKINTVAEQLARGEMSSNRWGGALDMRAHARALGSVDRATAIIKAQIARGGLGPNSAGPLNQQLLNLETTKQILTMSSTSGLQNLGDKLEVARLASVRQGLGLGIHLPLQPPLPTEAPAPSRAAFDLIKSFGITPTEQQTEKILGLDRNPVLVKKALGAYISDFLEFQEATKAAFANFNGAKAARLDRDMEQFMAGRSTAAAQAASLPALVGSNPLETMKSLGITHIDGLLAARMDLLEAAGELAGALKSSPPSGLARTESTKATRPTIPSAGPELAPAPNTDTPPAESPAQVPSPRGTERDPFPGSGIKPGLPLAPPESPVNLHLSSSGGPPPAAAAASSNPKMDECAISLPPAMCIELNSNTDNTYKQNYALQIDAGGDDVYLNNAGGSNIVPALGSPCTGFVLGGVGAGALLDLAGDDLYSTPQPCGSNGGATGGAGFLVDFEGNDVYQAGKKGILAERAALNGGGYNGGLGFLVDAAGDDRYLVKGKGSRSSNGGGGNVGSGFLLDEAGDDSYAVGDLLLAGPCPSPSLATDCYALANNGGGGLGGTGILVDLAGNDTYKGGSLGDNGGGDTGSGFLLEALGNDSYEGGDNAVNGGAEVGTGFLFDASGNDRYAAGKNGTNGGSIGGSALLVDAAGLDTYRDASGPLVDSIASGTGNDRTIIPKGSIGAQIDESSPSADLGVTIADSPDPVPAGQNLSYSIKVDNHGPTTRVGQTDPAKTCEASASSQSCSPPSVDAGPDVAADVTLTEQLPLGTNFTSATPSSGSCVKSGLTLTCHLGDLASGSGAQVTVVVTPHNPPGTILSTKVSVTSSTPDPTDTNNSATAETTVTDGEGALGISVTDAQPVKEGDQGSQTFSTFNINLSKPSSLPVQVNYTTADGTATASGNDYNPARGTLKFVPGQTAKSISVVVNEDSLSEADETLFLNLSNPTNAIVDNGQGAATILDDDPLPAVSIVGEAVKEGDSGVTYAEFTVLLSPPSGQATSVDYATADGAASVSDNDYRATSGTLTFGPGQTSQPVRVTVIGDTKPESDEAFFVNLSNPRHLVVGNGRGEGAILNDDSLTITISQYLPVREGDSGTTKAAAEVTLSAEAAKVVTVDYATADGTATAPSDYRPASGTVTFEPGQRSKMLPVQINGDTQIEPSENFFIKLSNPQNASFGEVAYQRGADDKLADDLVARDGTSPGQFQDAARLESPADLLAEGEFHREVSDSAEVVIRNDDDDSSKRAEGGGVFVTQHEADNAASGGAPNSFAPNTRGAQHIVQTAIDYVTDRRPNIRILLVAGWEGPGGPLRSALYGTPEKVPLDSPEIDGMAERGIRSVGFEACPGQGPRGCFVVADQRGAPGRLDLDTVDFQEYDAVVVSSDRNFRQEDLDALNRRSNELISAIHNGTGLVAFLEYFERYPLDAFGFLSCLRPAFDEVADRFNSYHPTLFGRSLGLTDADFDMQGTENFFASATCGLQAVNLNILGLPITLAGHLDSTTDPAQRSSLPSLPAAAAGALPPQAPRPPEKGPSLPRHDAPPPLPPRSLPAEQVQGTPVVHQAQQQSQQQVQEQMQAQMHQLAQANNAQAQPSVHIQGAVTREKQKAPAVTLARVEERAPQPNQASAQQGEYLASARQTAPPAGAAIGAVALMAGLLGLSRPRKQRARRVTVLHIKSGPIHKTIPPPRHRGR